VSSARHDGAADWSPDLRVSATAALDRFALEARVRHATAAMLEIRDLIHEFGARTVLDLPAWTVAPGQHSLVLGPSGSGKSTLLHAIAGLLRPSRGEIRVMGQELAALRADQRDRFRGRHIGLVLQRLHLVGALSVADNLRLARSLAGLPPDPERIGQLLRELGLKHLARARPALLSQGEAQRVAIARAVLNRPILILADEPTSALDDDSCATVLGLLRDQAERSGATLLIATHDARLRARFEHQMTLATRP
jgi:putative ABC transport system ATP-binding protein